MSTKLYLTGDSGPSGFGECTRGLLKHLLRGDYDVDVTCRTHFWGLNREGIHFPNRGFPDQRFAEWLYRTDTVNDDYLIEDPRDGADREDDLLANLGTNRSTPGEKCMVRQFEGTEDVWLAVGGAGFAEQAPRNPDVYTIVSTDFNLDVVPHDWREKLSRERVDEVWVPSEWTRDAVLERLGYDHADQVLTMPYGIDMDYQPTEYDCEVCAHNAQQGGGTQPHGCLRDEKVTFLTVARWYHIKGIDKLVHAFIEEFRRDDDVRLMVKTTSNNQFQFNPAQAVQRMVTDLGYPDPPEIGFATDPLETQYLYDLLGHVDAYVQPSRAECFGIAQLQAAYCGTPVIYTNWSAQKEAMDVDNPGFLPVSCDAQRPRQECPYVPFDPHETYPPDARWASPHVEKLQQRLREVYEMGQSERDHHGQAARAHVKANYQWPVRADERVQRLQEVAG